MENERRLEDLVRKAQEGCRDSFDQIVERYTARLECLIQVRLGPALRRRVEVEDVLQETYLRAFKSLPKFQWSSRAKLYHWLARILEHVILNLAREFGRRNGPAIVPLRGSRPKSGDGRAAAGEPMDHGNPTPQSVLLRAERFERLTNALDRLSEDHREVIILARIRMLPMAEIAVRMGRSRDAVSMLLCRALKNLKTLFGDTSSFNLDDGHLDRPLEGDAPGSKI